MAEIRGFFFDLDGTLVDTHGANFDAYRRSVEAVTGRTIDEETAEDLKVRIRRGESSDFFLKEVLAASDHQLIPAINQHKRDVYPEHVHTSRLNDYLSGFLKGLSGEYATVLVTTAKRANATAVLEYHGIVDHFSDMVFGEDVERMKPAPDAYLEGLRRTGLDAGEVVAFEDSDSGVAAARSAGIDVVRIGMFQ